MASLNSIYENVRQPDAFSTNSSRVYKPRTAFRSLVPYVSETPWSNYLANELAELQGLDVGWDGYGSPPVHPLSAHHANCLLAGVNYILNNSINSELAKPDAPYLVPVSGGALQAEWHFNNSIIEIFFEKSEAACAVFYSESNQVDEFHEEEVLPSVGNNVDATVLLEWFKRAAEIDNAITAAA